MSVGRSKIVVLTGLLLVSFVNALGQEKLNYTFKVYSILSRFGINKSAPIYNDRWNGVNLTFKNNFGVGAGIGIECNFSQRFKAYVDGRYNYWGGEIYAVRNDPTFYINLAVANQSVNIPLGVKYFYVVKPKYNLFIQTGMGMDYTFRSSFVPSNYYGSFSSIKRNTYIQTYFLVIGTGVEIKFNSQLKGTVGLEVNNDMFLNPKRYQDFGGFFSQNQIPLNYNSILAHVGIKF